MTSLLYGITEGGVRVDAVVIGVDGRPLRSVAAAGLCAWISEHDRRPEPTEDNLRRYEMAVEMLMARGPVLPARFGSTVGGDDEATALLLARRADVAAGLERVRDAVEIAVRLPQPRCIPDAGAGPGTSYLLERLSWSQANRHLAERLDGVLDGIVRERAQRPRAGLAYLVDRSRLEEFLDRVGGLDEPGLTCSGPWPPYSFVPSAPR